MSCFSLGLVAWGFKQPQQIQKTTPQFNQVAPLDTVPKNKTKESRDRKVRDLDDVIDELNAIDLKKEMEKVHLDLAEAMKEINSDKIRIDIEKAMKDVDFEKIRKDIETSVAKIDWDKIKKDLDVEFSKLNVELKKAEEELKKVDLKKLEIDMKKLEEEMKSLGPKIEKELEKAQVGIEKAKQEMEEYKEFVDGLQQDGLINKKEDYTIQLKNGELIINGKKQPAEVYSKYRKFLEKHKSFTIEKNDDDFNIDID